jgi:16S rRNA (uracil1498-N3)-methyltransferase
LARYDFAAPRLYVEAALAAGADIALDRDRSHYLKNVMRLAAGDSVLVFNGRDGEWRGRIAEVGKRGIVLAPAELVRQQTPLADLHYAFAPLKHARLDYLVQKAVEMGVGRLQPVLTRRTQVPRLNLDRARANIVEAAEQCGILAVPAIDSDVRLDAFLATLNPARLLVFCDEDADNADPIAALRAAPTGPVTLLVGPEGGFAEEERRALISRKGTLRLSLGPRILRADTAAVAALALVQAVRGDWLGSPA